MAFNRTRRDSDKLTRSSSDVTDVARRLAQDVKNSSDRTDASDERPLRASWPLERGDSATSLFSSLKGLTASADQQDPGIMKRKRSDIALDELENDFIDVEGVESFTRPEERIDRAGKYHSEKTHGRNVWSNSSDRGAMFRGNEAGTPDSQVAESHSLLHNPSTGSGVHPTSTNLNRGPRNVLPLFIENSWLCSKTALRLFLAFSLVIILGEQFNSSRRKINELEQENENLASLLKLSAQFTLGPTKAPEVLSNVSASKPPTPESRVPATASPQDISPEVLATATAAAAKANNIEAVANGIANSLQELTARIDSIEKERVQDKKTLVDNVEALIEESKQATLEATKELLAKYAMDGSGVHLAVLENLERYGEQRWVTPCDFQPLNSSSCRRTEQAEAVTSLIQSLPAEKSKGDAPLLRIVQVGACSGATLLQHVSSSFSDRVGRYVIVDPSLRSFNDVSTDPPPELKGNLTQAPTAPPLEVCNGKGSSSHEEFIADIHRLQNDTKIATFLELDDTSGGTSTLDSLAPKTLDVVIFDTELGVSDGYPGELDKWFQFLRNDGLLLGHGYGIQHAEVDNATPRVSVSWLRPELKLSYNEMAVVKQFVDTFANSVKEKTDGTLKVSGDTVWYLYRRKLSLANVFNN